MNKRAWAALTAQALYPRALPLFPRSRWMNSAASLCEAALLAACHNILPRALLRWLGPAKQLQSKAAFSRPLGTRPPVEDAAWDLSSSEMDGLPDGGGCAVDDPPPPPMPLVAASLGPTSSDWTHFNEVQKMDARKFGQSDPRSRLLVARICLAPQISLLHHVEKQAAESFDKEQWCNFMKTGARRYRVLECHHGELAESFRTQSRALACTAEPWLALAPRDRTEETHSLAWAMLSIASCSLHFVCFIRWSVYPFRLFQLLETPTAAAASQLLRDPVCLKDSFSQLFLGKYSSVRKLLSQEARAALWSLAVLARMETTRIECRHAAVRRFSRGKGETHASLFPLVSADFVLMRARRLARLWLPGQPPKTKTVEARLRRCGRYVGGRSGGGGARRSFLSTYLKGKAMGPWGSAGRKELFIKAHAAAKAAQEAGGESWQRIQECGRAGAVAHGVGGHAFTRPYRKRKRDDGAFAYAHRALGQHLASDDPAPAGDAEVAPPPTPEALALATAATELNIIHIAQQMSAMAERDRCQRAELEKRDSELFAWMDKEGKALLARDWPHLLEMSHGVPGCFLAKPAKRDDDGGGAEESLNVDVVAVTPPAPSLATQAMRGSRLRRGLLKTLRMAWQQRHFAFQHKKLPRCEKPTSQLTQKSACFQAGLCLCATDLGRLALQHADALAARLCCIFKKGSPPRRVYDRGMAVLCISPMDGAAACTVWVHVGYGNLKSAGFSVMRLAPEPDVGRAIIDPDPSGVVLRGPDNMEPATLPALFSAINPNSAAQWALQVYVLGAQSRLMPGDFIPSRRLMAYPIEPEIKMPIFEKAPRNLPLVRERAARDGQGRARGAPQPRLPSDGDASEEDLARTAAPTRDGLHGGEAQPAEEWGWPESESDGPSHGWLLSDEEPSAGHGPPGEPERPPPAPPPPALLPPAQPPPPAPAAVIGARVAAPLEAEAVGLFVEAHPDRDRPGRDAPGVGRGGRVVELFAGKFSISEVHNGGVHVGFGIVCGRHHNVCDAVGGGQATQCKKQILFGSRNPLSHGECILQLKRWIVAGWDADPEQDARAVHVKRDARKLQEGSADELEQLAQGLLASEGGIAA